MIATLQHIIVECDAVHHGRVVTECGFSTSFAGTVLVVVFAVGCVSAAVAAIFSMLAFVRR
jgi:hypothetical protein